MPPQLIRLCSKRDYEMALTVDYGLRRQNQFAMLIN
jgi:hypothetical protein